MTKSKMNKRFYPILLIITTVLAAFDIRSEIKKSLKFRNQLFKSHGGYQEAPQEIWEQLGRRVNDFLGIVNRGSTSSHWLWMMADKMTYILKADEEIQDCDMLRRKIRTEMEKFLEKEKKLVWTDEAGTSRLVDLALSIRRLGRLEMVYQMFMSLDKKTDEQTLRFHRPIFSGLVPLFQQAATKILGQNHPKTTKIVKIFREKMQNEVTNLSLVDFRMAKSLLRFHRSKSLDLIEELRRIILAVFTHTGPANHDFWIFNFNSILNILRMLTPEEEHPKVSRLVFELLREFQLAIWDGTLPHNPLQWSDLAAFCGGFINEFYLIPKDIPNGLMTARHLLNFLKPTKKGPVTQFRSLILEYAEKTAYPMLTARGDWDHGQKVVQAIDILVHLPPRLLPELYQKHLISEFDALMRIELGQKKAIRFTKKLFFDNIRLFRDTPDLFGWTYSLWLKFIAAGTSRVRPLAWGNQFSEYLDVVYDTPQFPKEAYFVLKLLALAYGEFREGRSITVRHFPDPEIQIQQLEALLAREGWGMAQEFLASVHRRLGGLADSDSSTAAALVVFFNGRNISCSSLSVCHRQPTKIKKEFVR